MFRSTPPKPRVLGTNSGPGREPASIPEMTRNGEAGLSPKDGLCRRILEYGLLALIVITPLPAASVGEGAILFIELSAFLLTAVYFLMDKPPRLNGKLAPRLAGPRYALAALFAVVLPLQVVPLPKAVVRLLSPRAFALQQQFSPRFAELKTVSLSLIPSRTLHDGLALLAYALIGFLVVRVITHKNQIVRMMTVIVGMGVFEAIYGLFELMRPNPRVLFFPKVYNLNSATGTFVNRNHYAGYLELVIPIGLALLISRIDLFMMPSKKWRQRVAALAGRGATLSLLLTIGLVLMMLALLKSNSRSGAALLLLAFVVFFELVVFSFGKMRARKAWILKYLKVVFVVVAVIALYSGIETMVGRFSLDNLLQDGRPRYWTTVLRIIKDFPVVGSGLGTFGLVYESYETLGMEGMLVHAHNDYLEYMSELGLIGFALLAGAVFFIAIDAFLTWAKRRNIEVRALALGGLVSVAVLLVHSITDFNLHIPANIVLFSVILSLVWSTVYYRKA